MPPLPFDDLAAINESHEGISCLVPQSLKNFLTVVLPRGKVQPADKLQGSSLVGIARSKQEPIDRGHSAWEVHVPHQPGQDRLRYIADLESICWSRKLDEQTKLADALAQHLKLAPGQAQRHALLKQYAEAGPQQLTMLLKQEGRPVSAHSWQIGYMMINYVMQPSSCQDVQLV